LPRKSILNRNIHATVVNAYKNILVLETKKPGDKTDKRQRKSFDIKDLIIDSSLS